MANLNLNKVILGGRLTADVELKTTPSGVPVCSFSLAVNRRRASADEAQQADFINCVAWRGTAEFISRYFSKGTSLCIVGRIQTRNYTDGEGAKHYVTEVIADEAMFVDSKAEGAQTTAATPTQAPTQAAPVQVPYIPQSYLQQGLNVSSSPNFEPMTDDDDLPF